MTSRATLLALAGRCERAEGPSRELDLAIAQGLWPDKTFRWPDMYKAPSEHWAKEPLERYTEFLDAAMTLLPKDHVMSVDLAPDSTGVANVCIGDFDADKSHFSCAATPALALTAACLRAIAENAE